MGKCLGSTAADDMGSDIHAALRQLESVEGEAVVLVCPSKVDNFSTIRPMRSQMGFLSLR